MNPIDFNYKLASTTFMKTHDTPEALLRIWGNYQPTPLINLPELAAELGVAKVIVKNEAKRPLGSFKSLGGMYAGLRALARHTGADGIEVMIASGPHKNLPALICASDGNHGLAVAAGAKLAGAPARVYLPASVPQTRANRITRQDAEIVRVDGTYEDAVAAAAKSVKNGEGILIADTTELAHEPAVADVMEGYSIIAKEIAALIEGGSCLPPTHIFLQGGVGGFASAMADGLAAHLAMPARIIVVEPETAASIKAGLAKGHVVLFPGTLETSAEMLACGKASAPALTRLIHHNATGMTVTEGALDRAVAKLGEYGVPTTPSGATGMAGLMSGLAGRVDNLLQLDGASRVLIFVTEGPVPL